MRDQIVITLFRLLQEELLYPSEGSKSTAGHRFEDKAADAVFERLRSLDLGFQVYPPRHTLTSLPTISGTSYQFDVVVQQDSLYHIIECKKRGAAEIDQLQTFSAKLLDYVLGAKVESLDVSIRGIFLTTAGKVRGTIRQYALAFGITIVAADLPPVEYMLSAVREDTLLWRSLMSLNGKLSGSLSDILAKGEQRHANKLLREWRICHQRWEQEGYK